MILSRVKFYAQERVDLEDFGTLLSAARTDSKLWTKQFLSGENYILKGFTVTGVGLQSATVEMDNATLVLGQGTQDFSFFISEDSPSDLTISDADLVDGARNYVELDLSYQDGTPITKAFWDPSANGGLGAEFNQQVNTVTDLQAGISVVQGGFTGDPDKVPLCIIDTDVSGNIKVILDRRDLFFRLGSPSDPDQGFTWASQEEPTLTVNLTGGAGTYVADEIVTFSGGATATVVTGGTTTIVIRSPSGINFASGDTLTGGTSGAVRTVDTVVESFTGADKDIDDFREALMAIMTEIRRLKGTAFWYQVQENSLNGISSFLNMALVGLTAGASWSWSGTELSLTDDDGTPASTDNIALIRLFGKNQTINLRRADGTGSTSTISIADGEVLFVKVPTSGNRNFSGNGSGDTNYQVVDYASFVINDENFWLAYREGGKLYVRGYGELQSGESAEISDPISEQILTFIGATSESDSDPNYTSTEVVTQGGSLVNAVSELDEELADTYRNSNQDRSMKLVRGGTWSWVQSSGILTLSADAFIQIPGLAEDVNEVSAQDITLSADGIVAYVSVKRTAGASVLTVSTGSISSLVLSDNIKILARRVGNDVLIGESFLLKDGEYLELDGAMAEISRLLGRLRIKDHETAGNKVRISETDVSLLDGAELTQVISSFLLKFDGAVINFTTGSVLKADDVTALGNNFTPFSVPVGQYFWYGISLNQNTVGADNVASAVVQVDPATSANASQSVAPKPNLSGKIKLGAVQVHNNAGTIEVVAIKRLGVGSGSGSGDSIKADYLDPVSTTLPSGPSVVIDGSSGVNGDLVLYTNLSVGNNEIYKLSGVGVAIAWEAQRSFDGQLTPTDGDSVRIKKGSAFADQLATFNGTNFYVNDVIRLFNGVSGNFWELGSIKSTSIANNTTANIFSVSVAGSENFIINYSLVRGAAKETGQLFVSSDGTSATLTKTNAGLGGDSEVSFAAAISLGSLIVSYTSSNSGSTGSMKFFTMRWSDSSGGPTGVPSYSGGGGGGSAGGSNTQIQYNNAGSLAGDARFTWESSVPAMNLDGLRIGTLSSGITVNDNQVAAATLASYAAATYPFVIVEYSIVRGTDYRVGRLLISNNGTLVGFSDDFVETSSLGITLSATISAGNVNIQYTSTNTGNTGTFKYALRRWS